MRFRDRLARFMQGRNGADDLARFSNGVGFVLVLLALVFTMISTGMIGRSDVAALVFRILYWVTFALGAGLIGYSLFRMFSRSVYKRQSENTRFLYQKNRLIRKWASFRARWKDRRDYRYLRCQQCGQMLRVPRNKGKIRVTCTKCGEKFITKT